MNCNDIIGHTGSATLGKGSFSFFNLVFTFYNSY